MKSFTETVYDTVARVPRGKVITYGAVAWRAGSPHASRAVGNIMHTNPDTKRVPCHRVICSDGSVGGFAHGTKKKIEKLKGEGVTIEKGRLVDPEQIIS